MRLNHICLFLTNFLLLFGIGLVIFGCASMQRPQGGPRDRTPPKLLKATPPNMTRNFSAKQIQLQFDEFFKLTNQYQEITFSPNPEKAPEVKVKQKTLVINFRDSLLKNTTYVINFGKAIADVTEGNVLKNFTYVFSTGPHIDSLSISGSVTDPQSADKQKDVTVMLFPLKLDSAYFGKKKPSIFTTTDSSGNFSLNNLHEGDYRIYALKEQAVDKIYNSDKELIAFLKEPIHLHKDTNGIVLSLFQQKPEKFRVTEKRFDMDGKMFFIFNQQLKHPSAKIIYPPALDDQKITEFSKTGDTSWIYMRNMNFDSIRVAFYDNQKPLDSVSLRKGLKEAYTRNLTFQYNIGMDGKLKPGTDLVLTASLPIETAEASLVALKEDSAYVTDFTLQKNLENPRKYSMKYRWRQDANYEITINENAFTDIYGDKNKKQFKRFQINKQENYSSLTLKFTVPDTSKAYVAQVLDEKKNILHTEAFTKNTSVVLKDYPTGKYQIKVVYDENRNGEWDTGSVKQGRQPEKIWLDPKIITLRPNWEAEEAIEIPKESTLP